MKSYELIINKAPISVNHAYGSRGKIRFLSKAGKEYKAFVTQAAKDSKIPEINHDEIHVVIVYYFPDKRRRDVTNYEKLLLDSFTGIFYKDDCQIRSILLTKHIDVDRPRTEITIIDTQNN